MSKQGEPTPMPPWPWEDERFKEPAGMTVAQFIAWATEAYSEYPEYLAALLSNSLDEGRPVELRMAL